ncbi:hypothetical protein [uncultured Bacteroides sp.]|uniref:hypothetical protein n=1 Tax=uncultured Bacteroides sp. TaxID=162156 RepID=UPI002AAC067B|nr:hypothetical protein [uncultured Bacteroides sp.]
MEKIESSISEQFSKLSLPECYNGLAHYIGNYDKEEEHPQILEAARAYQGLYNLFIAGHFALWNATRTSYPEYFNDENNKGNALIRIQFANNAIIWYNSLFDNLFQAFEFGKFVGVLSAEKTYDIHKEIWGNYKEKQGYEALKKFADDNDMKVRKWANSLKHRNSLRYKEFDVEAANIITVEQNEGESKLDAYNAGRVKYNSYNTITYVSLEEVISELIRYHEAMYVFSNKIFEESKLHSLKNG